MAQSVKLTISLPRELFEAVERECAARRLTRSELLRLAIAQLLQRRDEAKAVERYVRGYRQCPESDEEIAAAFASATPLLAQEPWG